METEKNKFSAYYIGLLTLMVKLYLPFCRKSVGRLDIKMYNVMWVTFVKWAIGRNFKQVGYAIKYLDAYMKVLRENYKKYL